MNGKPDYFKTFCKVAKAFGTTLSKDELLEMIVQSAIDTMGGKASCLFLADETRDVFVPVSRKGLSESYLHAKPMHAKRVVDSILKGGFLSVYDATTDARLENHEEKRAEGIASILVVPVMVKDKAVGVLSLYTADHREFDEDEANFLSALAEQGGMAIENATLFERLNRNSRLFYDLSATINSSLDIRKILHILSADIGEALGMKGVAVRLVNRDRETLDLVASYGLSEEFLNKGPVSLETSISRCLQGETVVIKTEERGQYREETEREGIALMLCVPIKSGDEAIGIMKLCSETDQEYPEDMITLVNALAHQGGLAIQNASMYLMLQEDKKSLEKDIWSHRTWF